MKVLWLVSITIPAAADACGLQAKEIGGGWLSGALGGMTAAPDAPAITVASVDAPASLAEGEVVTPGTMDDTAFQTFLNQELATITSSGTKMLQLLPESVLQILLPALSMM